jgi:hypothetical protein
VLSEVATRHEDIVGSEDEAELLDETSSDELQGPAGDWRDWRPSGVPGCEEAEKKALQSVILARKMEK